MRLTEMGRHFIEGRKRRGLGMVIQAEDGVTTLKYTGGDKIATITNRTSEGFTLTVHPFNGRYGCRYHCNRLSAVFLAICSDYKLRRYTAFQRWGGVRIWDNKLWLEIRLQKDTSFTVKGNIVALDYTLLESACLTDETEQPKAITTNPATNNSGEAINNLMALVATI